MANISFTDQAYGHTLLHWTAPTFGGWRQKLAIWAQRRRERRSLALFLQAGGPGVDRDLRDLGLNRAQLEFEAAQPFWRA